MMYRGHCIGGFITSIMVSAGVMLYTSDITIALIAIAVSFVTALYPDMDTGSKARRHLTILGVLGASILAWLGGYEAVIGIILLLLTIPNLFKHRGMVHTLKFGLFVSYCIFLGISFVYEIHYGYVITAGMLGYLTHLILDRHIKL